jgi:hypothetical protein
LVISKRFRENRIKCKKYKTTVFENNLEHFYATPS